MLKPFFSCLLFILVCLAGCQTPDNQAEGDKQAAAATQDTVQHQPRPKPEHYSFKGLEKKRVFICMDSSSDTFHQKHDCPVLITCKSTFRNLTIPRAIEDFDRYNCETCSSDLAHIFDEDAVQMNTGFGE